MDDWLVQNGVTYGDAAGGIRKTEHLAGIIVKKECRNQGVGHVLLDYLIQEAKSLGYVEMSVGVDIDNARARHLFEKKGFTAVLFEGRDEYGEFVKLMKRL